MHEKWKQLRSDIVFTVQGLGGLSRLLAYCEIALLSLLVLGLVAAELWCLFVCSYTWLKQLFKYLVIWIGLLGASLATQSGDHISITVIPPGADSRLHRSIRIVANLASTAITLFMAIAACQYLVYEKLVWESGTAPGTDTSICKLYLPTHDLSGMERQAAQLDQQNNARLGLVVGKRDENAWDDWQQELANVRTKIQERQQTEEKMQKWKNDWLQRQWSLWQPRLAQAWQHEGEIAWQQHDPKTLAGDDQKWFRLKWQEQWMTRQWQQKWQAICEESWQQEGKKSLPEGRKESDFAKEWQAAWISRMWQKGGREEWLKAWQDEGRKLYFRKIWSEAWLQRLWQTEGSQEWAAVDDLPHQGTFRKPSAAQTYQEVGWTIPRWLLLVILPVSLFIMAFRFALRTLQEIFVVNEEKA
jgi:TRAP-type C4-dicarboxylate transport system permease small subunit